MAGWDYFREGSTVGGSRVLARLNGARLQTEVLYRVRYGCCGTEAELTHAQLRQRERNERHLCKECARKALGALGAPGAPAPKPVVRPPRGYPPGGSGYADGLFYRFARGRVWRWDGCEWLLSTRSADEISWAEPERQSA